MAGIVTVRNFLLAMLFVVVVMAIYFAMIPSDFYHRHGADRYKGLNRSLTRGKSAVLDYDDKTWIDVLVAMAQQDGVVYTTMINDAYFDFAASWLCNTKNLGNIHRHVLFLTTDRMTGERLKLLFPEVSVIAMDGGQFAGKQEYSKAGYVRMMVERTHFILRLLEAGLRVLLFEVDCLWLSDPVPILTSEEYSQMDIVGTKVSGQDITAGGFLLLRPTQATLSLWRQLTRMMEHLRDGIMNMDGFAPVSESQNDQQFISQLIKKQYANIKVAFLPKDLFPDGKWYNLSEALRAAKPKPVIINNNWVLGNAAKIERAKLFGHWFWDSQNSTCNGTAYHKLVNS